MHALLHEICNYINSCPAPKHKLLLHLKHMAKFQHPCLKSASVLQGESFIQDSTSNN